MTPVLLQGFAARAGVGVRRGIEDKLGATEAPVGTLALVPHRHMRSDALLLDHPGEDLGRSVGAVSADPLRLQAKAGLGPIEHGSGSADLGPPARTGRLDIDDDRRLEIDQVVVSVGEKGVPLMRSRPLGGRV